MAAEAAFQGGAFGGRNTERGEVEDSCECFFGENDVVLVIMNLGLGWVGAFVEGRSVAGGDCGGEMWDGECGEKGNRRFVVGVREDKF